MWYVERVVVATSATKLLPAEALDVRRQLLRCAIDESKATLPVQRHDSRSGSDQ